MKVQTPSGEKYRVRRRWLPWRRRARAEAMDWMPDVGDLGDDPVSLVLGAILAIPLLLVMTAFFGELLMLLLLLPFFVLARSVFGTPWVIEVSHRRHVVHVEAVSGWGESRRQIERLATRVRQGDLPLGERAGRARSGRGRSDKLVQDKQVQDKRQDRPS